MQIRPLVQQGAGLTGATLTLPARPCVAAAVPTRGAKAGVVVRAAARRGDGDMLQETGSAALRQCKEMKLAALGLGAGVTGLLAAGRADAFEQVAQLADADIRAGVVLFVVAPAFGWVLYNILEPAIKQYQGMKSAALGLGAGATGLLLASRADAVDQVAELAELDVRAGIVLFVVAPALGWVLYNILGPGLNQLDDMKK